MSQNLDSTEQPCEEPRILLVSPLYVSGHLNVSTVESRPVVLCTNNFRIVTACQSGWPFTCSEILKHDKAFGDAVGGNPTDSGEGRRLASGNQVVCWEKPWPSGLTQFSHRKNPIIRIPRRGQIFQMDLWIVFPCDWMERETVQWLRKHTDLAEDLSPGPGTHVGWLRASLTSAPGDPTLLACTCTHVHIPSFHTHH